CPDGSKRMIRWNPSLAAHIGKKPFRPIISTAHLILQSLRRNRITDWPQTKEFFRSLLEQFQEKCERFSVRNCVKTKS
ncbi:hypothetical protein, partial [Mesorhizobium sp. M2E.F.Ca.ET.209.01.1.1]|uniref:hypothetical protein n=1 Tax=Mesorhizobium sp. M2E.F.Ca.ET.209.01.1.1 TaxID=2500526 RepID=UPI001AEE582F